VNRRLFLRLLGLAPIVGPSVAKAAAAAAPPAPMDTFRILTADGAQTVQRWAGTAWIDAVTPVYLDRFQEVRFAGVARGRGDIITFTRIAKLEAPSDATRPERTQAAD
jgi:hypothetical protein